jgi:hypothetical protein
MHDVIHQFESNAVSTEIPKVTSIQAMQSRATGTAQASTHQASQT